MKTREQLGRSKRWIIKVGSSLLTNHGKGLDYELIDDWVKQIAQLHHEGHEVILVSSGAVAEGVTRLNWSHRPDALHELQAAAAVGQMGLIQAYESRFQKYDLHTAQILLTHADLSNRRRYLNARSTLATLLKMGVIPVVNENDTVAADEIRFGDNDTLAALVANLVEADLLVILTDQNGMYDSDPRNNPEAQLISEAQAGDPELDQQAASGAVGEFGRGGMLTKVRAAVRASRSGTSVIIASGREESVLSKIASGQSVGTLLHPNQDSLAVARKRWLAELQPQGSLRLDDGAVMALKSSGGSLLAIGVVDVKGTFTRGDLVICMNESGQEEIARGLVNYNADEVEKIKGNSSDTIQSLIGYLRETEVIGRDNLVLTQSE
ncbi:MAG: glutamate 5-kinase [Gammaproteobacteria bacterium]|nr:glutamate 5-kinase [Gammaproteobacteria bacterium]